MLIQTSTLIYHPPNRVYAAYRDELPAIVLRMPVSSQVTCLVREDRDQGVYIHNIWSTKASIPRGLNLILKSEHLRWNDFATWNDRERHVDWTLRTGVFPGAIACSGRTQFLAEGEATRIAVEGDFSIQMDQVRGFPRMVKKRLKPAFERFIVGLVTPNIARVNAFLQTYLDETS